MSEPNQVVSLFRVPVPDGQDVTEFRNRIRHAFEHRAKAVDALPGFEGFEMLSNVEDEKEGFIILTRWKDRASYEAYLTSDAFAKGHKGEKYDAAGSRPFAELWEVLPIR